MGNISEKRAKREKQNQESLQNKYEASGTYSFSSKSGKRVRLSNANRTAERHDPLEEYDHAIVISAEPLSKGKLFEIKIDDRIDEWNGTFSIGVTTKMPSKMRFRSNVNECADTIVWSGSHILKDGNIFMRNYSRDLDDEIEEGDRVGVMLTKNNTINFFINGEDHGEVYIGTKPVWALVDLYGDCTKVSIISDASETEASSKSSCSISLKTGKNVILSNNNETARRANPKNEFKGGIIVGVAPLQQGQLFQVRIDEMIDRWSGSIEIGVTKTNLKEIDYPEASSYLKGGTCRMTGSAVVLDGNTIMTNYGQDLNDLKVGDFVGVMLTDQSAVHFYVNGKDQGAVDYKVDSAIWPLVDIHARCVQVTMVETAVMIPGQEGKEMMRFHEKTGSVIRLQNGSHTAKRTEGFNQGVVMTYRPLEDNELFEIKIDTQSNNWNGTIEVGITDINPATLSFPSTMTDLKEEGITIMVTLGVIVRNGEIENEDYGKNDLENLKEGDRIGLMRKSKGNLHFFVNGKDLGVAAKHFPKPSWGVVDLYGQVSQVTIVSEDTIAEQILEKPLKTEVDDAFLLVAAVDFGTTFSGYAFSFRSPSDPDLHENIRINKSWGALLGFQSYKTATSVLVDKNDKFIAFGFEAEQMYGEYLEDDHEDKVDGELSKNDLHLYRHFKMILHRRRDVKLKSAISSLDGTIKPAMNIFAHALRYLKGHLLNAIKLETGSMPQGKDIRWVITVPAIWRESSNQFMREAAVLAGFIESSDSNRLLIALEPEAASLCCRNMNLAQFIDGGCASFSPGTKYIVVDCGGGTVDLTAHIITFDNKIKEIMKASGGACGGTKIDAKFTDFMESILGKSFFNSYRQKQPQEWLTFLTNFEKTKKSLKPGGKISIPLPWAMASTYSEVNKGKKIEDVLKAAQGITFSSGMIVLKYETALMFFDPVIKQITSHVEELTQNDTLRDLQYILMVGGFSECSLLQTAIKERFENDNTKVLIPGEAQLAIIKGAILFGHDPQVIKS